MDASAVLGVSSQVITVVKGLSYSLMAAVTVWCIRVTWRFSALLTKANDKFEASTAKVDRIDTTVQLIESNHLTHIQANTEATVLALAKISGYLEAIADNTKKG